MNWLHDSSPNANTKKYVTFEFSYGKFLKDDFIESL